MSEPTTSQSIFLKGSGIKINFIIIILLSRHFTIFGKLRERAKYEPVMLCSVPVWPV